MFYAARVLGTATANISDCSGASPEGENCAAETHIEAIIARLFTTCNADFALAKANARKAPNRSPSSATACGGFYSVKQELKVEEAAVRCVSGHTYCSPKNELPPIICGTIGTRGVA
jgi:hypothetical protein